MTPPLLRFYGRPLGQDLGSGPARVGEIRISPELRRLTQVVTATRDSAAARGSRSLASLIPNCAGNPDCHPDLALLPQAIEQGEAAARGNPGLYRMVLNFIAAQLLRTEDAAARTALQDRARIIARAALTALSDPGFNPPAEDEAHQDEPVRTRTRMLFDISCTLSAILASPGAETYNAADRALLHDYFQQIQSGTEQSRIRSAVNPNSPPFPPYFEHFVRAQMAMLDNNREDAFRQLLAVRVEFQGMEPERRGRALASLVDHATELALQTMPRDPAGEHVETLRTLLSLEALGYFYQVDYSQSHSEAELSVGQRHASALNLVASVYLNAGLPGANAQAVVEALANSDSQRSTILQALEQRFNADPGFQQGLRSLYSGGMDTADSRRNVFSSLLRDAGTAAQHLANHHSNEPYRTVYSRDGEGRNLPRAIAALNADAVLLGNLRVNLALPEDASAEAVARQLTEMGELLPVFLQSLPETVRNDPHNASFFNTIRQAAQGYRGDGMRSNVESPLVDLLEALHERANDDDVYASAYHAFFQGLQNLEHIAPDATLSPALRQSARRYADAITNFSWGRVARHLGSAESVGMMLGGIALTELAPIWMLRGARIPFLRGAEAAAAVRTTGEMGVFVRGGELTWQGEMAVGVGVGAAMHVGSLSLHLAFNRAPGVSVGQELSRLGPGTLALGFLTSMLAMGGTMVGGRLLRRGLLPEGATLSPGRQILGHLGLRLGNWAIGGGLMIGAHSATAALTGHSATPTGEQAAEIFLSMALWDAASAGLRFGVSQSRLWHHQIGPFRTNRMIRENLDMMFRIAPELRGEEPFLQSYLQAQLRDPGRFQEITRALARREIPRLQGTGSERRLIFTPAPLSGDAPLTRTGAARVVLQLTETEAARVRRILDSAAFGPEARDGIGPLKVRLRTMMANGVRNPKIWVRARLDQRTIHFEILAGRPSDEERDNTFLMDTHAIRDLQTDDPVLRAVIAGYVNESFTTIPPPSGGRSSARQGRREGTAPASPPARPQGTGSAPADTTGSATVSIRQPQAPAHPVAAPAAPVASEPVVEGQATVAGRRPRVPSRPDAASPGGDRPAPVQTTVAPSTPAPAPEAPTPPQGVPAAEDASTGTATRRLQQAELQTIVEGSLETDTQSTTAPQRPSEELLDQTRRSEDPAVTPATAQPSPRRPRGDVTVPFTTEQARSAREGSRPDAPLPDTGAVQGPRPARSPEMARTRRIEGEEAERIRRQAMAAVDPIAAPASGEGTGRDEESSRDQRVSEPPIDVDPEEVQVLDIEPDNSTAAPAPPPAAQPENEFDFSGVMPSEDPGSEASVPQAGPEAPSSLTQALQGVTQGVTLRPPRVPAEAAETRPAGPPPLPRRGAAGGPPPLPQSRATVAAPATSDGLREAIERDSSSAIPLTRIRRRVADMQPVSPEEDGSATVAARIPVGDGRRTARGSEAPVLPNNIRYEDLVVEVDRFLGGLYEALQNNPELELFTIQISPTGEMEVIHGVLNFQREAEGYGYFTLRHGTVPGQQGRSNDTFTIESPMHLSPEQTAAGWEGFLRTIFQ